MEKKLMTAKSYRDAEIIKTLDIFGKPYARVKIKCDRCVNGIFPAGVENGQIKPHPNANGVCFKCGGQGYEIKDVRLYTEKELENMERANERAREKRAEEQEKKMKAEFEANRVKWLAENGWSQDGVTYAVSGDSYSIKDELKAAGFKYDPVLKWHKGEFDENYADRLVEFKLSELVTISAWGKGTYAIDAAARVVEKMAEKQPESTSEWIGEVGGKILNLKVQLVRKHAFESRYGLTNIYGFQDENGNVLTWFSTTFQPYEVGDWMTIKCAAIKNHDEYKGVKQTTITRAKLI